jgi:hypothetical protein
MQKKTWAAVASVGIAAAVAIPTIAFGNARRDSGSLRYLKATQTPYVTRLTGAAEVPNNTPGSETNDPDGFGGAAVTFDLDPAINEVCWDLTYGNLTGTPLMAHIHGPAAPGVNGPVVIGFTPFSSLGANSATGCRALTAPEVTVAADIVANPGSYYVNVHTSDFPGGAIRGQLAAGPAPAGEIHMLPTPLRAYDSRDNNGVKINPGETRTISLATGRDGANATQLAVPPGATAALITLTVAETGGNGGFLVVYSADLTTQPATSNINWKAAGQDIAVNTQVFVDALGRVKVSDVLGGGPTQFMIDVVGYLY